MRAAFCDGLSSVGTAPRLNSFNRRKRKPTIFYSRRLVSAFPLFTGHHIGRISPRSFVVCAMRSTPRSMEFRKTVHGDIRARSYTSLIVFSMTPTDSGRKTVVVGVVHVA
jgi:hypothetical protein